jgi:hypothetical protein
MPQGGGWWPYFYHRGLNGEKYMDLSCPLHCPYGETDDLFWVRETHYAYGWWIQEGTTETGKPAWTFKDFTSEDQGGNYHFMERAPKEVIEKREEKVMGWYKRPAIFMPYSACRIWLQKTGTKVERASEISREDAIAEGLACLSKDGGRVYKYGIPDSDGLPGNDDYGWHWQDWHVDPVEAFKKLWVKVNGMNTWNDWVWCNSFNILSTTGKPDYKQLKAV